MNLRLFRPLTISLSVILGCQISVSEKNTSAFAQISESTEQRDERERLERKGRVEKAKREIEAHIQKPVPNNNDYVTRAINDLAAAQINYDAAKKNKDKNRTGYLIALVELANANFTNKEYEQASKCMSEAYSEYELLGKDSPDEPKCRKALWETIGMLPSGEFQRRFEKLFRISEEKTSGDQQELISHIDSAPNLQEHIDLDGECDKKKLFKSAIDIRAEKRGHNDPSLYWFLDDYGRECEIQNDMAEAEKAFVWMSQLRPSSKYPQNVPSAQIRLVRFYVDRNQFEKADAAWPNLLKLIYPQMHASVVGEFSWLATQYISASRLPDADKIASAMLAAGGDHIVSSMSSVTNNLVNSYIDNLSFEKAQALLTKRVKASDTCKSDYAAGLVRLELSNIDLALGQVSESQKLFEEVKKYTALKGRDIDKLLENREKLEKALKK